MADIALAKSDPRVRQAWALHGAGLALVVIWLAVWGTMPVWAYVLAVYLAHCTSSASAPFWNTAPMRHSAPAPSSSKIAARWPCCF